ncbi:hypothetical protein L218DRAFT_950347 [Marasmius fiardii PR-910]|nr:hypothetical protein L218DRAFT_950347 [Marasmius fiardii PR-910]
MDSLNLNGTSFGSLPPSPSTSKSPLVSGTNEDNTSETTIKRPPIRDLTYYIDEQMSIFLVDDHLFRVHRHFLRNESVIFDTYGEEGQSDEKPIELPGVTRSEFVVLMDYFYKGTFFKRKPGRDLEASLQDYIDLLSIASRYECTEAHQKAILGIESLSVDPIQKIILSDKYNVQHWLMPAYIELCKRDKPPNKEEASRIGLDKAMLIADARENVRSCRESRDMIYNHIYNYGNSDSLPPELLEHSRVERIVNEVLKSHDTSVQTIMDEKPGDKKGLKKYKGKGKKVKKM